MLGNNAIKKIEENPYLLLDITYGIDFKKIDKMAMDLGIDETSTARIQSAIKYSLVLASYNGNTCVEYSNLIRFIIDLLDVSTERLPSYFSIIFITITKIIITKNSIKKKSYIVRLIQNLVLLLYHKN